MLRGEYIALPADKHRGVVSDFGSFREKFLQNSKIKETKSSKIEIERRILFPTPNISFKIGI